MGGTRAWKGKTNISHIKYILLWHFLRYQRFTCVLNYIIIIKISFICSPVRQLVFLIIWYLTHGHYYFFLVRPTITDVSVCTSYVFLKYTGNIHKPLALEVLHIYTYSYDIDISCRLCVKMLPNLVNHLWIHNLKTSVLNILNYLTITIKNEQAKHNQAS